MATKEGGNNIKERAPLKTPRRREVWRRGNIMKMNFRNCQIASLAKGCFDTECRVPV